MEESEARKAKLNQKNLYHLVLCWSKDVGDCYKILEFLQPNQRLKVLDLTGYMGSSFPLWISSITNLIKISITDCGCKELPTLGQLPFLKELQLNGMMNLECIDQKFYGDDVSDLFFPSLEQLELYDLPRLLKWSGARVSRLSDLARLCCSGVTAQHDCSNSVFFSLKTLKVEGCPKLQSLPSLPTLPNLILKNSSNTILYSLTSFTSLSSLLINDMEVGQGVSFGDLGRWESLKKLVLCNIKDTSMGFYMQISLTALEHLVILHCHELTHLSLNFFPSLKKLHIVDCPSLSQLLVEEEEENTQLMELVVEDCPQANAKISFHKFHYLRKLILKNCSDDCYLGYAGELKELKKLEYLSISGCLKLERKFQAFPWLISHIPCIILGNNKANFKDSNAQSIMEIKFKEIKKATRNFRADMMLGEGGFGTVFKGWMHEDSLTAVEPGSGIVVAVKILRLEGAQGLEQWTNEVKYLSQLRHPNLVKLIGYCNEKDSRILVYEFMRNGSLDFHLFTKRDQSLSWATRINVAVGAARGLSFLHDLEIPVIHRDVKSRVILLDGEFKAKLSDFGLAKDGPIGDMSHVTTQVVGTFGYLAPECTTGHLSPKSDVYGFGVVLLELLSGRAAYDRSQLEEKHSLVEWAISYMGDKNVSSRLVAWPKPHSGYKRKLTRIMDTRLNGQYPHGEAYTVAKLAMQCVSTNPKDRPRMAEVVVALHQLLPKKQGNFVPGTKAKLLGEFTSEEVIENEKLEKTREKTETEASFLSTLSLCLKFYTEKATRQELETFKTPFLELLRDISEATRRRREQSETDYQLLLRNIFNKGGPHDSASLWAAVCSRLRADNVLRKIIKKAGLCNTAHADPEVDIENLPAKVLGREQEMTELFLKCCNPGDQRIQLSAIPILGPSGIGKTALARLIYEDELVLKHFDIRVWVEVDGQEITLHHAAQQILKSAMGMVCSIDDLDEMVRDSLLGRKCLIIFDGVESITQDLWLHMNKYWFDFIDLGSVVLITTPSQGVANLLSNQPFELKPLSPYGALSLCHLQFPPFSSDFEHVMVNNLENLCGYIPLLLKLVGSMMIYDDKLRHLLSEVNCSDAISLPTFDGSVSILLCVWALPPQLRQCLAFCASFPQGYALDREKIINMWVAHGLVKPSCKKNPNDIGDSYFHQLLCRAFFTDIARNEYGDITEFRMPGLIHTTMQDVAAIVWKEKVGVIGSISEGAHLLSLHSEGPQDVTTLIFSSTLHAAAISLDYNFLDFQELQSLDLSCSGIRNISDDVCALRELKYLNLSYTLIERLPDSITGLKQLKTLDLSWCYHFKVVPKAIRNMKNMCHLDLLQCESLSYMPSGIGFLVSLTSMPLFVLGKDRDNARLGELGPLNQLRGRLEIRNLENVMEISEAGNAKLHLKKLHHLGLSWSKDAVDCFEVLKVLKPNGQLKVVDITGYMGSIFPLWISSMSSLTKILISDCGCEMLPSLGRLPLLKELQLKGMTNIEYIGPNFYGYGVTDAFPSLEQLGLYDIPNLVQWSGAMVSGEVCRCLKTLTIEGCPRLLKIPTFINQNKFGTPSSLLIKNMKFGIFFEEPTVVWHSLKKLILFNTTHYLDDPYFAMSSKFTELEHLGITHCPQVRDIDVRFINSIQKLHVVECPNLEKIYFSKEATTLAELVVDGCPELHYVERIHDICWLTKLIIGGSDEFIRGRDFKELKKLQYLSITECPMLEEELNMEPSLISHIPCVLLSNRKVQYKYSEEDEVSAIPGKNLH